MAERLTTMRMRGNQSLLRETGLGAGEAAPVDGIITGEFAELEAV